MRNLTLISKTVWLQALRRKDLYVVFILAGFFGLWVLASRIVGIDSAGTASFLMSLGLSSSYILSAIIAAAMASRQLPGEFESRTLYPLLAKPITRGEIFLGKALGVTSISIATLLALVLITYLPTPKPENQQLGVLIQAIALQSVALALLSVGTMAVSIHFPAAVSMLISLAAFFAGAPIVNYASGALGPIAGRALVFVPDFSIFNQVQRFVDSQPSVPMSAFAGMIAYGIGLAAAFYLFAAYGFSRKPV